LRNKTDIELIKLVKGVTLDSLALKEIIRRHSGIFVSIVNNICPFKSSIEFKDLLSDKDFYIYRTCLKYDENKGAKFCTFLGNEARWLALNLITYKNKYKTEDFSSIRAESTIIGVASEGSRKNIACKVFSETIQLARKDEDPRVKEIFKLRYIIGDRNKVMTWKKIAKKLDLSIQGSINIHNNFIEKIKNKIL
jgi:DNA-directed RNA polymerase specialized sigma subunit|tara:strand:+ start:1147 stop:1728 length:582 start_codon:yes stop_codon:yes gene_type:complete